MRFGYREYDASRSPADQSEAVWRPALKVVVSSVTGGAAVPLWGILDTGAVECVLPRDVADEIKPDWLGGEWFLAGYEGRPRPVEYGAVRLKINLGDQTLRWTAIVAFSVDRDEALWGHAHFLDHFNVAFNGPDRHFTIRQRGPRRPSFEVNPLPRRFRRRFDHGRVVSPAEQNPDGVDEPS